MQTFVEATAIRLIKGWGRPICFLICCFLGPLIAPVPTASKHPEGLGFPTGDTGTEGWLAQITAKACLACHQAAEREGRG